jgi:hypothetical protein
MSGNSRKFGRCKERPSNKRYTAEQRWVKNKAKAIAKNARAMVAAKARKAKRIDAAAKARPFSEPLHRA